MYRIKKLTYTVRGVTDSVYIAQVFKFPWFMDIGAYRETRQEAKEDITRHKEQRDA